MWVVAPTPGKQEQLFPANTCGLYDILAYQHLRFHANTYHGFYAYSKNKVLYSFSFLSLICHACLITPLTLHF